MRDLGLFHAASRLVSFYPPPPRLHIVRKMNTNMYIVQEHAHEYANEYEDKLYIRSCKMVQCAIVHTCTCLLFIYCTLFILYVHENEHVHKDE